MGLFGGSGDTSGSFGSASDTFESKLRTPSTELDFSESSSLGSLGGGSSSSDFETRIQIEQQKAELVGQVSLWSMSITWEKWAILLPLEITEN